MTLILTILSLILNGYLFYLLKKLTKETNTHILEIKTHYETLIDGKTLYLLDEVNNKIKTSEELLLEKLKEINKDNQEINQKMHKESISKEFKNLKFDVDKTLKDMIKSVENIKLI